MWNEYGNTWHFLNQKHNKKKKRKQKSVQNFVTLTTKKINAYQNEVLCTCLICMLWVIVVTLRTVNQDGKNRKRRN